MIDVKLMRWVDGAVGAALCRGLAAAKTAASIVPRARRDVRTIAVMKFFGLGSIIVASPSLAALREAYPNAKIIFVTFKANREILEILNLADQTILIDNSSMTAMAKSTLAAIAELRRQNVDLAIDFEFFAKYPLALASLSSIRQKAGFYLTLEPWRQTLLDVHGYYNHYYHTRDIFLSLIYLLVTGDKYYLDFDAWRARYAYPKVEPSEIDRQRVRELLAKRGMQAGQKLILVNPNSAIELAPQIRRWPEERYSDLGTAILRDRDDAFVAFVGAKSESDYTSRVATRCRSERAISLAGELSLRELVAALSLAQVFVTNDSGPMHLACVVGTPTVGLFFAESPVLYAPLGQRVEVVAPNSYAIPMFNVYNGKNAIGLENIPAQTISVEHVLDRMASVLSARGAVAAKLAGERKR